jgi:hypothetical protein
MVSMQGRLSKRKDRWQNVFSRGDVGRWLRKKLVRHFEFCSLERLPETIDSLRTSFPLPSTSIGSPHVAPPLLIVHIQQQAQGNWSRKFLSSSKVSARLVVCSTHYGVAARSGTDKDFSSISPAAANPKRIIFLVAIFCFADNSVVSKLLANHDEGSLFKWSSNSLTRQRALRWNGNTEQRKRVHQVGYLVELVHDLSIARDNNISGSPGFELPLGGFPIKKR